jgi:aminomethyltransferase
LPTIAIEDMTESSALIAFQGPSTADVMSKLGGTGDPLPRPFSWANFSLQGKQVLVGRTGYTGEDGFEIVAGSADAVAVWQALLDSGAVPCGLGARDVLRLEAGLPLHGHEIDEHTSPVEAGLDRFVSFDKEYVGAPLLKEQRESGVQRKLVGLKLPGRSAPREGYPVLYQGQQIGQVTSGTYSPTLDTSIAMGYVLWRHAALGQALDLDIRGRIAEATVVPLPFYSRPRRAL